MSIMEDLCDDAVWDEFLASIINRSKTVSDAMTVTSFVMNREYRPIVDALARGEYTFSNPIMIERMKSNGKKRVVYTFKRGGDIREHTVLRVMGKLLSRYGRVFAPNLYSEGKNGNVLGTVFDLLSVNDLKNKYFFKFDVTDYANSINREKVMEILRANLDDCDQNIGDIIEAILKNPHVTAKRKVKKEIVSSEELVDQKGAMTGLPFTTFLSGLYLNDMDWHFYNLGIPYFRYNDDVLVVGNSEEDILDYKAWIIDHITEKGLSSNEDKMSIIRPGQGFKYLGLAMDGNKISITDAVVKKKKLQVRKKADYLNKMAKTHQISRDTAFTKMIEYTCRIFFNKDSLWNFSSVYFPKITSCEGLNEIDRYTQDCIRYVYTGNFRNTNKIKVPYSELRARGYVPLVSAYRYYTDETKRRHAYGKNSINGGNGNAEKVADEVI